MKRTIEMILMTVVLILAAFWLTTTLTACSSSNETDDDRLVICYEPEVHAFIIGKDDNAYEMGSLNWRKVSPLTMDNILAYNPESGYMKLKDVGEINEVAYPLPEQHRIAFYSADKCLFSALLNSSLSSFWGGSGLIFMHMFDNSDNTSYYQLMNMVITDQEGVVHGELTEQEKQGLEQLKQILSREGKVTDENILPTMSRNSQ
jgi:hypothetical protein